MIKIGKYSVCVLDLVTDSRTGRLSASKLWLHIANSIMSYIMLKSESVDWILMTAFGGIVGGSYVAVQLIKSIYAPRGIGSGGMDYSGDHGGELPEQAGEPSADDSEPVQRNRKNTKRGKR